MTTETEEVSALSRIDVAAVAASEKVTVAETVATAKITSAETVAMAKIASAETVALAKVAEAAKVMSAVNNLIVSSLSDLRATTGRIESRMDTLVETTNHRLDDFREDLDKKVDKTALLTSVGFKLANLKVVRWGLGVVFATVAGTVAVQHWWNEILGLLGG